MILIHPLSFLRSINEKNHRRTSVIVEKPYLFGRYVSQSARRILRRAHAHRMKAVFAILSMVRLLKRAHVKFAIYFFNCFGELRARVFRYRLLAVATNSVWL